MRICVVTSLPAAAEPRAPRHAVAAQLAFPDAEVILVDMRARNAASQEQPILRLAPSIRRRTVEYAWRGSGLLELSARKTASILSRALYSRYGVLSAGVFGDRTIGLAAILEKIGADVYIAHNIETLFPAWRAAQRSRASLIFDCMEYYSDMGDGQTELERTAARMLETRFLKRCRLVLASSEELSGVLCREYGLASVLPLSNAPELASELPGKSGRRLDLYWRNSVVEFGQRGLDDALAAMTLLPDEIRLYVQGRLPEDGGRMLRDRIEGLGIAGRVVVLPPYPPGEAVRAAAKYHVGLCLERRGPRNHDLTVSNKMFDYHMAGMAVVSSNLPSLRNVIEKSGGGLLFEAGSPQDLAKQIRRLYDDPSELEHISRRARTFALTEGNMARQIDTLIQAMRSTLPAASRWRQ